MQARIVEARQGAIWLLDGWRLFRAAPLGWLAMVFAYWIIMTLASVVPFIGVAAASIMVPAFSVGFMAAARAASRRAPVELTVLFDGFRQQRKNQLILGVVYLVCLGTLLSATTLFDDGALASWMVTGRRPSEEALQSDDFLQALVVAALLYTPVLMAFWFAPPLVAWHGVGPVKALFFSFVACLLNWRPFLVYGALSALVVLVLPLALLFTLMLASLKIAAMSLVFPVLLVLLPTLFASFYASYRDIFGVEPS
jgi:hypothetical protein